MAEHISEQATKLEVSDFGPIANAEVKLRPFTVFVGPSNTGKSYLAILIYALHQFFNGGFGFGAARRLLAAPLFQRAPEMSDEAFEATLDVARSLATKPEEQEDVVLPNAPVDALRIAVNASADNLVGEICRCFGVGAIAPLIRRGCRPTMARVTVRRSVAEDSSLPFTVTQELKLGKRNELKTEFPAGVRYGQNIGDGRRFAGQAAFIADIAREERDRTPFIARELLGLLGHLLLPGAISPLHHPAYYLPADRTGVMHAHSVVVSALIANAPTAGLRPAARTPVLSGVLADFLDQLISIDRLMLLPGNSGGLLAAKIETDILRGSVHIERSPANDYPRFVYRPEGWKDDVALANASSMVSELAPVVLYLRHVVGPDSLLIVEEPESHLHPAMQVEFTRRLAALVNAGIRVIVTTHSEWLLEELGNIVRRSQIPKSKRAGIALRPDQVGLWLFEPKQRPKGSVVREIPLDEYGFSGTGFDEVASALHNEWAETSSHVEGGS